MLTAAWLMLSTLLYSLQLNTGSFPKPLTAEEERHYLALAQSGDLDARNVLIERNLRLVAHIMKKYYTQTSDQEDLISIGTIGLMKGIQTFDPSKGARLATYAARCVENATLSPTRLTFQVRIPAAQNTKMSHLGAGPRKDSVLCSARNGEIRYVPPCIHKFRFLYCSQGNSLWEHHVHLGFLGEVFEKGCI